MRLNSLAVRLVAGAAIWSVLALASGGWLLSSIFRDFVERSFEDRLNALAESLIAASSFDASGELYLVRPIAEPRFDQPYSGWYWQVTGDDDRILQRSRSLWDQVLEPPPADSPATLVHRYIAQGPAQQRLRVFAREVALPGADRILRYSVGADPTETEAEISDFNTILFWSLAIFGGVLLAAILIQVVYGLQPLRRVGSQLAAIREGRRTQLEGSFPAEIAPLAQELNALLAHNAAIVERARTHVGNLAHGLKTPLSVLMNEASAAAGGLGETVRKQTDLMRRQVDHYLVRARTAATGAILGARSDVAQVVEDLRRTLALIHRDRDLAIIAECPLGLTFRGERQDLEEMVGNLIDNACKWARSRVEIRARGEAARLILDVEDDGPGLDPSQRTKVLARGARLDESVPGSGLGLAIVRDIAGLYDGSLELGETKLGGLRATLVLPAVQARPGR